MRYALILVCGILGACTPKQPVAKINTDNAAQIVRNTVGTSIIGAKGATSADQDAIDETVVGPCAIGAFTKSECARHKR